MPIQRSLRIRRTHSFDALRCAESSKRLPCPLKISIVLHIPMFRRPPVILVFAPSKLRTVNEVSFKQHDKRKVIGSKVNGFHLARTTGDPAFAEVGDLCNSAQPTRSVSFRCRQANKRPGDHRAAALPYSSGGIRATNFFRFRPQVSSKGEPDFRSGAASAPFSSIHGGHPGPLRCTRLIRAGWKSQIR